MMKHFLFVFVLLFLFSASLPSCGRDEGWYSPCEKNSDCGKGKTTDGSRDLQCITTNTLRDPVCTATCSYERSSDMKIDDCIAGDYDPEKDRYEGQCSYGCCLLAGISAATDDSGVEYIHGWCVPGI